MIPVFLHNLEALFDWLLAASWQASVLALLVLGLQRVLRGRLNPRWRYALWLLVLARLVLPALPESALSLFQFAPPPPAALEVSVTEPLFIQAPIPVSQTAPDFIEPTYPFSVYTLLALVWLAGALLLLFLTWQVNKRFARQVADSPEIADPELRKLFAAAKNELGLRRSIRLIENGQVQSPAIMGLFQPTLLLPADVRGKFDATELRLIFLHELAHLKRGDVIAQGLIALLQILHWFNPVLRYAFRRMRIDREPATDALVLSRAGEGEKERYGLMLIKLLEHFNQRHSLPTLVGILEDKDQFKRRFSLIARFTRGAYGWSLLGVLLIGVLAVACLTKAKAAAPILPAKVSPRSGASTTAPDPTSNIVAATPGQPDLAYINKGFLGSALNPPLDLVVSLVEVDEAAYAKEAAAMDLAVKNGDLFFFTQKNGAFVAPETKMTFSTNKGWYSMGEVQSLVGSVKYEKQNGKPFTTINAAAIFIGINADFVVSSSPQNGLAIDSTWSDIEPISAPDQKFDPNVFPADAPKTLDLTPRMHTAKFIDQGWKIEPGKTHGFWVGQTLGQFKRTAQFKDRWHASLDEMIKTQAASRLAVFMTAQPVPIAQPVPAASTTEKTDSAVALIPAASDPNAKAILAAKLNSLRIDHLDFKDTPLGDVIGALQAKSKQADPDKQGVNFVLRVKPAAAGTPANPASSPAPTITLTLADVSLADALGEITKAARLRSSVEEYAVYLRPADDGQEPFTVRTFLIPAGFFQANYSLSNSGITVDVKAELIHKGIEFPGDASAIFLPGSEKLVARDTPEQLDKLAGLVDAQSAQSPTATPPVDMATQNLRANLLASGPTTSSLTDATTAPATDIAISGKIRFTRPELVDLAKSIGYLVSVDGGSEEFYFQPDGSFALPHVKPGVYNRHIRLVRRETGPLPAESVDVPLSSLLVDSAPSNLTMNLNLDVPFKDVPKGSIQVELKVVEIPDDVYQAHQAAIDAGVEKGGAEIFNLFNNLKGVSMLSTPSVTTRPGQKADIEIVREFPYPTRFENAQVKNVVNFDGSTNVVMAPITPREFTTKNIGVSAEITPSLEQEKIVLNGKFSLTDFEGFTKSNLGPQMPSFTTRDTLFLEALDDNQEKGIWIPGFQGDVQTITENDDAGKTISAKKEAVNKRLLIFLSARLAK